MTFVVLCIVIISSIINNTNICNSSVNIILGTVYLIYNCRIRNIILMCNVSIRPYIRIFKPISICFLSHRPNRLNDYCVLYGSLPSAYYARYKNIKREILINT